jgi:hypothetical protein
MSDNALSNHIAGTYLAMRRGLSYVAFALPWILWIGGHLRADLPLQHSMSAYYHAGNGAMHDWFVGILFMVSIVLFVYKGFTRLEDRTLNLAAILITGVAVFPMSWPDSCFKGIELEGLPWSLHGTCAISFFLCIAYVCLFRAGDTLVLIPDEEKDRRDRYRRLYRICGACMIAFPLIAFVLAGMLHRKDSFVFFAEAAGVYVFATYWLIKSKELDETDADLLAARGALDVEAHTFAQHAFRPVKITVKK